MALQDLLDHAASHRTEVTVYAPEPWPELAETLGRRNVVVRHEETPETDSGGYVVVRRDGEFRGAVSVAAARVLEEPSVPELGHVDDERFSYLVSMLVDAVFGSLDRRQLLATSREFEDRAWRVGSGTLHAGFQRREAYRAQERTYELLARDDGLDVHVYAAADWTGDPIPGVTHHGEDVPELAETWFVVYDGGDEPEQGCALVAVEREEGVYEGCWTYEREWVASLDGYLRSSYW